MDEIIDEVINLPDDFKPPTILSGELRGKIKGSRKIS